MLCDLCKKNTATVRVIAMVDGMKIEKSLCAQCVAQQRQQMRTEGVQSILSAILGEASRARQQHPCLSCSACGMEYDEFLKTNRLGCPTCYRDFSEQLAGLLPRLHGHTKHVGRAPKHAGDVPVLPSQAERLRRQLEVAIAMEEFEQAAQLRDELRALTVWAPGGVGDA